MSETIEEAAEKSTIGNTIAENVKWWVHETYIPGEYGAPDEVNIYLHAMDDLSHGCASGCVGHLISYTQTQDFYAKYKGEINELLQECGMPPAELFGKKWDEEDPLALDTMNQNLLAWFGFETVGIRMLEELAREV